eukprot:CAMPEP_0194730744 /NCGR_PEP_ID=MMETSP0296-20130528/54190_1 /TAXON_ID=39354 /ORGANISM="Heterosigma akashiwo, Strain CCMP2393" /LENGTH=48 /DNA_ID= /DNA_START= /DNA_END= /DNA_ORIENTATION=
MSKVVDKNHLKKCIKAHTPHSALQCSIFGSQDLGHGGPLRKRLHQDPG